MAKATFIKAQNAAFTNAQFPEVVWSGFHVMYETGLLNVTGVGGSPSLPHASYAEGLPISEIVASGYAYDVSAGVYAKSQAATATLTNFNIEPTQWVMGKVWPLVDVTGPNVTESASSFAGKQWEWGVPEYYFKVRGWVKANGPDITRQSSETFTLGLDLIGSFSGTAMVKSYPVQYPAKSGGPIGCEISGYWTGGVTYTKGDSDWDEVFLSSNGDPVRELTQLTCTNGDSIPPGGTQRTLAYHVQASGARQSGGPVGLRVNFRFDTE